MEPDTGGICQPFQANEWQTLGESLRKVFRTAHQFSDNSFDARCQYDDETLQFMVPKRPGSSHIIRMWYVQRRVVPEGSLYVTYRGSTAEIHPNEIIDQQRILTTMPNWGHRLKGYLFHCFNPPGMRI